MLTYFLTSLNSWSDFSAYSTLCVLVNFLLFRYSGWHATPSSSSLLEKKLSGLHSNKHQENVYLQTSSWIMCEFPVSRKVFCCLNRWLSSKNLRSDSWFQYNLPSQKEGTYYTLCHMRMHMGLLHTWHIESRLHQCNPGVSVHSKYFVESHRFEVKVHWKYDWDNHHWHLFGLYTRDLPPSSRSASQSTHAVQTWYTMEGTEGRGEAHHRKLVAVSRFLNWFWMSAKHSKSWCFHDHTLTHLPSHLVQSKSIGTEV